MYARKWKKTLEKELKKKLKNSKEAPTRDEGGILIWKAPEKKE